MTNEDLVKRLIESKSINFDTIGKLVAELGPELSASKTHLNMVLVGKPFILACMMPAADAANLVGQLHGSGIGAALKTTG